MSCQQLAKHAGFARFARHVDAVLYINLEHRTDRQKQVLAFLDRISFPREKTHRIDAVYWPQNGHKGCCLSHIRALEFARDRNFRNVWIIEDDTSWRSAPPNAERDAALSAQLDDIVRFCTTRAWDVILLSSTTIASEPLDIESSREFGARWQHITCAQTADNYLVNCERMLDALLRNFRECSERAPDDVFGTMVTRWALDQTWKTLQRRANARWFGFRPTLTRQRGSFSDIMNYKSGSSVPPQLTLPAPRMTPASAGKSDRRIWMIWVGPNPLPAWLRLCYDSFVQRSGVRVELVTDANLAEWEARSGGRLHPNLRNLSYVHQADYLRCYLLHFFGGLYADVDSVCLRNLEHAWDRLRGGDNHKIDIGGYDGARWGEVIGVSAIGPARAHSPITRDWFAAVEKSMERASSNDPFEWSELLRDILQPVCRKHVRRVAVDTFRIENPQEHDLLDDARHWRPRHDTDVLILNNALYGSKLENICADAVLAAKHSLASILRQYAAQAPRIAPIAPIAPASIGSPRAHTRETRTSNTRKHKTRNRRLCSGLVLGALAIVALVVAAITIVHHRMRPHS